MKKEEDRVEEEVLVVEVYLKSRKFESKIQVPLYSDDKTKQEFVDTWFNLMMVGLRMK